MHRHIYVSRRSRKGVFVGSVLGAKALDEALQTQLFKDQQLILSAQSGNLERVCHLLSQGANPNSTVYVLAADGVSSLGASIVAHDTRVMNVLFEHNADVNMVDSNKRSPLEVAIMENFETGFNLLLSKNANLNAHSPKAQIIVSRAGYVRFCNDKDASSNSWLLETAQEVRPATMYDLVLSNICRFSEETKNKVRSLMDKAVKQGILVLTASEIKYAEQQKANLKKIAAHRRKKTSRDDKQNTKA